MSRWAKYFLRRPEQADAAVVLQAARTVREAGGVYIDCAKLKPAEVEAAVGTARWCWLQNAHPKHVSHLTQCISLLGVTLASPHPTAVLNHPVVRHLLIHDGGTTPMSMIGRIPHLVTLILPSFAGELDLSQVPSSLQRLWIGVTEDRVRIDSLQPLKQVVGLTELRIDGATVSKPTLSIILDLPKLQVFTFSSNAFSLAEIANVVAMPGATEFHRRVLAPVQYLDDGRVVLVGTSKVVPRTSPAVAKHIAKFERLVAQSRRQS